MKPTRCTHFSNLFWNKTLHVPDSSSVHHQEFVICAPDDGWTENPKHVEQFTDKINCV